MAIDQLRRSFNSLALRFASTSLVFPTTLLAAGTSDDAAEDCADRWMINWLSDGEKKKKIEGVLQLQRFKDPFYVLLKPINWSDTAREQRLPAFTVPAGFVTDFASVPRPFWTIFRPDGEYAYAAVLHDYLYWEQPFKKDDADLVFRKAMDDLDIKMGEARVLYAAVKNFGYSAWEKNVELRNAGESRVLKKLPKDPAIKWADWKLEKGVFRD